MFGVYGGYYHTGISHPCRVSTVPAHHTDDSAAYRLGQLKSGHKVGTDVLFQISSTHGKHKYQVTCIQVTGSKPGIKYSGPSFIVSPCGQFGNIIGGRIRFNTHNLAKVIDRVGGVGCAAADAKNKHPPSGGASLRQNCNHFLNHVSVELCDYSCSLLEIFFSECPNFHLSPVALATFCNEPIVRRVEVRPIRTKPLDQWHLHQRRRANPCPHAQRSAERACE